MTISCILNFLHSYIPPRESNITIHKRRHSPRQRGPRTNGQIRTDKVRVIDPDGEMLGVMPTREAVNKARNAGLDLVEISPNADPPVCKILDYGKYQYEAQKKAKEAKKKQKVTHIKEIKFRVNTDIHDYQVKMRNARKFLEAGDKVKVSLRFRGREITHKELGAEKINKFAEELSDIAKIEQSTHMEGRQYVLILAPE